MRPCHWECQQKNGSACVPKCCKPANVFATLGVATSVRHPLLGRGMRAVPLLGITLAFSSFRLLGRSCYSRRRCSLHIHTGHRNRNSTHDRQRTAKLRTYAVKHTTRHRLPFIHWPPFRTCFFSCIVN